MVIAALSALTGCTIDRETSPQRTATEQLMLSTAADRAAEQLTFGMPEGTKVFVDSTNFDAYDGKYAIAKIRSRVLESGANLVNEKEQADAILEIRSGALSTDDHTFIVGIPSFQVPIPFAGELTFPELALFKKGAEKGVAKFAAVGYDTKTGKLIHSSDAKYGFSTQTEWVVLLLVSWKNDDFRPKGEFGDPVP